MHISKDQYYSLHPDTLSVTYKRFHHQTFENANAKEPCAPQMYANFHLLEQ